MDQSNAVSERGPRMLGRPDECTFEVVEDRQQLLHEPLVCERDVLLPLTHRALAEVVEVGGRPLPAVGRLVALGDQSGDGIVAALICRCRLVRELCVLSLGLLRHYDVFASSSTTSYPPSST